MKKRFILLFSLIFVSLTFGTAIDSVYAGYDNHEYHWSFKRDKGNETVTTEPEFLQLLEKHGGVFIGDTNKKELYLTFDNGYENGYTKKVLDVLKEKNVPAAFFVTGHYLTTEQELIKRMIEEGHIVGNHSWHHPSLPAVSDERLERELDGLRDEFSQMTGGEEMNYLRPPRGTFSERSLALSNKLGYTNVFWSMAYKDWETDKQKGAQYAYDQIMERIAPGAILLLHSVSKDNADALARVITDCKKQGYTFKSLDDLMIERQWDFE